MKHRKPICLFVVSMIIVGIFAFTVLYYETMRSGIYYNIEYEINLSNREEIIYKVENLNYTAYLNNPIYPYTGIQTYVDRALINLLKNRIENDVGFKLSRTYQHNLRYSFLGENHSKIYLTYSNYTIFNITDQNNQSLFLIGVNSLDWGSNWYLNFTHIPFVYGNFSTLVLSELIFVEINVEYEWTCGYPCYHEYSYEQYLLLNKNLDVILIFIYNYIFID